jgi:RNA polymerase sigma factor (sigma-70 family)
LPCELRLHSSHGPCHPEHYAASSICTTHIYPMRTDRGSAELAIPAVKGLVSVYTPRRQARIQGTIVESTDHTFQELLDSARRGHSKSFEQIYTKLNQRVHAYVRVRGAIDPEGMVNDVFLAVFTRLGSFSGNEAQFNAWVFTISRNKLIDETRKQQRRVREVSSEEQGVSQIVARTSAAENVEDQAIVQLTTEGLAERLQFLTDEQRDAMLLRVIGDLSIEAIAEIMDKQPGAVRGLLRRAIQTIARIGAVQL